MQTTDLTVRLKVLNGTWETCGADRAIGVDPESLVCTANEWGPEKASFTLRRSVIAIWPDLSSFTPVEIEIGGIVVWYGRTEETPFKGGSAQTINVQCVGMQYHLDDDVYSKAYVHAKLTDWRDVRSFLESDLTKFKAQAQVGSGQGQITLGWAKNSTVVIDDCVGVILDTGVNNKAARAVITLDGSTVTNETLSLYVRGGDTVTELMTTVNEAISAHPAKESATLAGTFPTASRYIMVFLIYTGVGGEFGNDNIAKITSLSLFSDTAYESGGVSILKASQVIKDSIKEATLLLSSDLSQIAATEFDIPDFALTRQTTPRETIEAANAYHNYITKVDTLSRLIFQPRPAKPQLEIGAWDGSEPENTSSNSGAEIYNRVLVEAQEGNGESVLVERTSTQQPDVDFTMITSPSPNNPSFTTNTEHWEVFGGEVKRVTTAGEYHTAPAGGEFIPGGAGSKLSESITGTFKKGVAYQLSVYLKSVVEPHQLRLRFGAGTDVVELVIKTVTSGFLQYSIVWTPQEDIAGAFFDLVCVETAGRTYVDDVSIASAEPTLVDRRKFRRTKVLQVNSAITPVEGQQLGDIYLQGHMATPFKGETTITRGGVRRVIGGGVVHPSLLLLHTQELLRISDMIDPDTGGVGRDGTIASVTYTHKTESSQVTLDDQRHNFEALLQRLAVVQQVGS